MECNREENAKSCNCTYSGCPKKGICCECLSFHLGSRELPACCFDEATEATYDRSFDRFVELVQAGKV